MGVVRTCNSSSSIVVVVVVVVVIILVGQAGSNNIIIIILCLWGRPGQPPSYETPNIPHISKMTSFFACSQSQA